MVEFINNQKIVYYNYKQTEIEKNRLTKALITDELTGLYNHKSFFNQFDEIVKENNNALDVLYIDIDKFKNINEVNGYEKGDEIIIGISEIILDNVNDFESIYRYGGEEFIILVEDKKDNYKFELAEKIRKDVISNEKLQKFSGYLPLTISIGISNYPNDTFNPRSLVNKAEKACYFAKKLGNNKTIIYSKTIEKELNLDLKNNIHNNMFLDFAYALSGTIDMKDEYTGKHSEEVSRYAMLIAEELELNSDLKYALRVGGLLHDLGKLSIPDSILKKTSELTEDEYNIIKNHPIIGYNIIKELIDDNDILSCIRWHHERCDGKGYPDGLIGENIPLLAKIICVADAYHTMTSIRTYRNSIGKDEAIKRLVLNIGTQFDGKIVDAFINILK
jgi:diguanylate cyclase (GGDEF)-like protein/putative nucleotidyltransferase with HDIG domain